jgi:hypothetical protein
MKTKLNLVHLVRILIALAASVASLAAYATDEFSDWVSFSANLDAGYRNTQFFEENHNVGVVQWDSRLELWLPPHREVLSFGPYVRFTSIAATKDPAWENALLAGPGFGGQVYPFSLSALHDGDNTSFLVKALGPLRLFGEYNFLDYWGEQNSWRPNHQIRAGADYWLAMNSNDIQKPWWLEAWAGGWYQSANEFDPHYDGWIFAQSLRSGPRVQNKSVLSWLTPYAVLESSLTDHQAYYWENRLSAGGGLRIAPPLHFTKNKGVLTRLVLYAEYVLYGHTVSVF